MSASARLLAIATWLLGCEASAPAVPRTASGVEPPTPEPAAPTATPGRPSAQARNEGSADRERAEPSTDDDDACVTACVASRQMEAIAAEAIEASCRARCAETGPAPEPRPEPQPAAEPDAACKAAIAAARRKVESVPMQARAPRVFAALADPAVSCKMADPVLAALSVAGDRRDRGAREAALAEALRDDPRFTELCPAGTPVLDEVLAQPDPRTHVAWLVAECPIDDAHAGEPLYRDLGPMTYLAIETIARRWKAAGATTSDHDILLDVLRLSSGLETDASR